MTILSGETSSKYLRNSLSQERRSLWLAQSIRKFKAGYIGIVILQHVYFVAFMVMKCRRTLSYAEMHSCARQAHSQFSYFIFSKVSLIFGF
uniref:Uncharacterized protein n=1 Tax=Ixodes ricinus TaxID=34613 RepID=A0A6B0U191_IXORI